jgi:hypothetical protein
MQKGKSLHKGQKLGGLLYKKSLPLSSDGKRLKTLNLKKTFSSDQLENI